MNTPRVNYFKACNLSALDVIEHYFFTRNGGVSTGDFTSLNTSYHTPDNADNITQNRSIVINHFHTKVTNLITLKQQSQAKILVIDENNLPLRDTEGDALITTIPGIAIGILTADCAPLLLADPVTKTIAAVHAGHNGAYLGIVEATIDILVSQMQVDLKNVVVAIGPSIKQATYEVQNDFYDRWITQNPNNHNFFIYNKKKNNYFFSLQSYIIAKLRNLNITNIEELPMNTYTDPANFFSHRYSKHNNIQRGLQISTIVIKE